MSPPIAPTRELLLQVIGIARLAGDQIMAVYRNGPIASQSKADDSPLTQADLRSHQVIVASLQALSPRLPVLSEESSPAELQQRRSWQRFWLVDPLDGTREFLSRNGEFTVNIALVEDGAPVLGVVLLPAQGVIYAGARGLAALRIDADGGSREIQVQRSAGERLRVVGSRSHRSDAMTPILARLGAHELVSIGSSIKFCLIAEGHADLYPRLGPTSEWDTAAGHAVLEAAGGTLRRLADGTPLRYNQGDGLLNPHFIAYADERALQRWVRASAA